MSKVWPQHDKGPLNQPSQDKVGASLGSAETSILDFKSYLF